jgi:DNA-binding transcriptional ArsR family regulator
MRGTDAPETRRRSPTEDVWSGLEPEFVRDIAAVRLKALGHPERLRIVEALSRASMNVSQLGSLVGISRSAASRHLRLLADADVVRCSRQGNFVVYALADRDAARLAAVAYRGAGAQARRRLAITRPS